MVKLPTPNVTLHWVNQVIILMNTKEASNINRKHEAWPPFQMDAKGLEYLGRGMGVSSRT